MANIEANKDDVKKTKANKDGLNFITKEAGKEHKQGETVVKQAFGVVIETNY